MLRGSVLLSWMRLSIVGDPPFILAPRCLSFSAQSVKVAGSVYTAPSTSRDHCAPSLVGVAAGSANIPAHVESSTSVNTTIFVLSAPSATVPQCTVAPSSFLATTVNWSSIRASALYSHST